MENIIKIEFVAQIDKSISESSIWNTREEFFQTTVVNHLASDYNFLERQSQKMEESKKEEYKPFLKTLKGLKESINESIQYELVNVNGNIEEVKISFSFKHYETPLMTLEKTIEGFIFNSTVQDNRFLAEDLPRLAEGKDVEKDKLDSTIKMFNHIADFMEEAKSSLVVTKNGIENVDKKGLKI